MLLPLDDRTGHRPGGARSGPASRPATAPHRRPHLAARPCRGRAGSRPPRAATWRPCCGAGVRGGAPLLGRPARGRRPPGRHDRPHRRRARRRASAPGPGPSSSPAPAPCCATSSPARPYDVSARAVVNAAGVWAGEPGRRRPPAARAAAPTWSCAATRSPASRVALTLPVPGARNRFVNVLPQPDGLVYVGLTDEAGRRRPARRPRAEPRPRSTSCSPPCSAGLAPAATPSRRGRLLRRAAAAARRADGAHRRPVPPARRAHLARPASSPSSAAS